MVITRTPLRISFVGGGSDMECFYSEDAGAVVSATISKYIYINVNKLFNKKIRASYSVTEEVSRPAEIAHPLIRSALKMYGIENSIEISSMADIPKGTGLGSSSAFTVGLIKALSAYLKKEIDPGELAQKACDIEINMCGEPIGKQDQYSAATGGFNQFTFNKNGTVTSESIFCDPVNISKIENHILLFYTGISRKSSEVLRAQKLKIESNGEAFEAISKMKGLCAPFISALKESNLPKMGEILHENWVLKRSVDKLISNPQIDSWYQLARDEGAYGGKLLGAGNGGFLMFLASPDRHQAIKNKLKELIPFSFHFEFGGSRLVYQD